MSSCFNEFNLLPTSIGQRAQCRRWGTVWIAAMGVAVPAAACGILLIHMTQTAPVNKLRQEVIEASNTVLRLQGIEIAPVQTATKSADDSDPRQTVPEHWGELLRGLAVMSGGEVGFERIDIHVALDNQIMLTIEGIATGTEDVLRFASTIEESELFGPMGSPSITYEGSTGSVRFELLARIPAVAEAWEGSP